MKKTLYAIISIAILVTGIFFMTREEKALWTGVDETVVEHYAEKAGRPAREPFLATDRGDLLLFLFLLAGAVGGFIGGYCFRGLFPPGKYQIGDKKNV